MCRLTYFSAVGGTDSSAHSSQRLAAPSVVMKPSRGVVAAARDGNALEGLLFLFVCSGSPGLPAPRRAACSGSHHAARVLPKPRPKARREMKYPFVNSISLQKVKVPPSTTRLANISLF